MSRFAGQNYGGAGMDLERYVADADDGRRAVDVLRRSHGLSRTLCKNIRIYGKLRINGQPHRMIDPVRAGDLLQLHYVADGELEPELELRPSEGVEIIWQDRDFAVISKAAGLLTHPRHRDDDDSLLDRLARAVGRPDARLHPVMRLDRGTSGLIVVARHSFAHESLAQSIDEKAYIACIHGRLPAGSGLIQLPIGRRPDSLIEREVRADGRAARSRYRVLASLPSSASDTGWISWVELQLETGRTHQLRVHLAALGCPIVGDSLYGTPLEQQSELDRRVAHQALHAYRLRLRHPRTGEALRFTAPLPDALRALPGLPRLLE